MDETPDGPDGTAADAAAEPAKHPSTRRPTAAASAASRARRIGGARTTPTPSPSSADADAATSADADGQSAPPVPTTRSSPVPNTTPTAARVKAPAPSTAASTGTVASEAAAASEKDRAVVEVPAWLRWVPAGVLTACAVAMLVVTLVAAHGVWYSKPSGSALRDQVLAAAKTCTAAANTYSYQTIPQDEAKGLACSTGKWTKQYRTAITTIVKPAATKLKASQAIQINNAGIESISSNGVQWTIVLYGQTKITQNGAQARLDPFSAEVTMQHVEGKWLIAHINLIVNPSA